jgi:hypothetical protein
MITVGEFHIVSTDSYEFAVKETWKESLKQKFKNSHRPMINDAEVMMFKSKFGRKTPKRTIAMDEAPRCKTGKVIC